MKLLKLELENFKGTKSFSLTLPDGKNVVVHGRNHVGKSTLADAYCWLLLGKNAKGESSFDLKTQGTTGLDYAVAGTFQHNGREVRLKRVLRENWTRKNGSDHSEFRGNKTDYLIDDVPKSEGKYKEFVREFFGVDEKTLSFLTNPSAFSNTLKDTERRDILLALFAADVDDQTLMEQRKEFHLLLEQLNYKNVDEYAEQVKAQRRKINEQLAGIPGRIDEAERAKPCAEFTETDRSRLGQLLARKSELDQQIHEIENGETMDNLRRDLAQAEEKTVKAKLNYLQKFVRGNEEINAQIAALQQEIEEGKTQAFMLERKIQKDHLLLESEEQRLEQLRKQWETANARKFDGNVICPTCGQTLPKEKIKAARETFHLHKSQELEGLQEQAGNIKREQAVIAERIEQGKTALANQKKHIQETQGELDKLSQAVITPPPFEESPEYEKLSRQQADIQKQIDALQKSASTALGTCRKKLQSVTEEMDALKQKAAALDICKQQDKRIQDLKEQESLWGRELAACDAMLSLIEKFITTKADAIESQINQAFQLVRWKLFEQQINGGIKPCCRATMHNVEYNALSGSEKVNAGLDIIQGLGQRIGIQPPVWVDEAESTTEFLSIDAQMIRLKVSEQDKTLRVEVLQ